MCPLDVLVGEALVPRPRYAYIPRLRVMGTHKSRVLRVGLNVVLLFGRWQSERAAREFIRRGEVAILHASDPMGQNVANKVQHWARSCDTVFEAQLTLAT